MPKNHNQIYQEALNKTYENKISFKSVPKEEMTTKQFNQFLKMAKDFTKHYVHDIYYPSHWLKKLWAWPDNLTSPFEAREQLIALMNRPSKRYHTNCLGSATIMSYKMQKLGIPHNIMLFLERENGKLADYNGVILYKYHGQLLICDIFAANHLLKDPCQISDFQELILDWPPLIEDFQNRAQKSPEFALDFGKLSEGFLHCPYEQYVVYFPLLTDSNISPRDTVVIDPNIQPNQNKALYCVLPTWPPEILGLLSKEKYFQVATQVTSTYHQIRTRKKNNETEPK